LPSRRGPVIGAITYPGHGLCARLGPVDAPSPPRLVGRAAELAALDRAVDQVRAGSSGGVVCVEGEPGIGKSALLERLAAAAARARVTVLAARGTEFESDLPFGLWNEALATAPPAGADRHRAHRELRAALEDRAATDGALVVCLDDVHWADPASADALAALVRRPPAGPVLLALATRPDRAGPALSAALGSALREGRLTALAPAPLHEAEAREVVGAVPAEVFAASGGNPFYLQELARAARPSGPLASRAGALRSPAGQPRATAQPPAVPAAVAAALGAELAALDAAARRLAGGAAVAGDPFDAGLAGQVAALEPAEAADALDALLAAGLVRPAGPPRRFAFRHPVVHDAVLEAMPGGRRLEAHGRAAAALERRGAGPVERAHHVEFSADPGDEAAIALLQAAADGLRALAPATAARFHAGALRLLPDAPAHAARRARLQGRLAEAQAAAGRHGDARATLVDALRTAPDPERLALTVAAANAEWWLGLDDDARRRLQVALGDLPAAPSADRIRLRLALALTTLWGCDLAEARAQADDALLDALAVGDPVFEVAARAAGALARATEADDPAGARTDLAASAALLAGLRPDQVATRLPAFWMHGRARQVLGDAAGARADLARGAELASETGRESVLLLVTVESVATLVELGALDEALAAAQDGVDLARLARIPRMVNAALSALSTATLATGDVSGALAHAGEAQALAAPAAFLAPGQPGWALGAALTAAGNPGRAVATLLEAFGGPELGAVLPSHRPRAAADLVEAQLDAGDVRGAAAALDHGGRAARRAGTPAAAATIGVARAAVELARGDACAAVASAGAAASGADAAAAPLTAALARLQAGRALAAAGDRRRAIDALDRACADLERFGAARRRDEAVRELRRLGRRVTRPRGAPSTGTVAGDGRLGGLTAREREIAELVAAGRTNREIAEQLVLSTRTVEAHLRNVFAKLGVRSRVELTRAVGSA